jgi:TPR repeat protein
MRILVLAALAVFAAAILGIGGIGYFVFRSVRLSEAYRMAMAEAGRSRAVRDALGDPIEPGLLTTGTVGVTGPSGEADLRIPVSGPKGEGALYVRATKTAGAWTMTLLQFEGGGVARVDLLKDAERETLTRACDGGRAQDCDRLAIHLTKGTYGEKDLARAAALFGKSCQLGWAGGCGNFGVCYENGWGVKADIARATALYEQACAGGHFVSCEHAGSLPLHALEGGAPVSADVVRRAKALLERACDHDVARGCSSLGVLHERGWGTRPDAGRAAVLYRRGCDGGYVHACANLAHAYAEGRGVPADPTRSSALYTQACDAGHAESCRRLPASPRVPASAPR